MIEVLWDQHPAHHPAAFVLKRFAVTSLFLL